MCTPETYIYLSVLTSFVLTTVATFWDVDDTLPMVVGMVALVVLLLTFMVHATLFPWGCVAPEDDAGREKCKSTLHASRTIVALALVSFHAGILIGRYNTLLWKCTPATCAVISAALYMDTCVFAHWWFPRRRDKMRKWVCDEIERSVIDNECKRRRRQDKNKNPKGNALPKSQDMFRLRLAY